jgi:hypothetical protein
MHPHTSLSAALLALARAPNTRTASYRLAPIAAPEAAGLTCHAFDVNNRGDLVGTYTDAGGNYRGYLLIDGAFEAFDVPGSMQTVCTRIADDRRVMGTYIDAQGLGHRFQWADGRLITIDDLVLGTYTGASGARTWD